MLKQVIFVFCFIFLVLVSCTRENAPEDVKKAKHYTQLFYDQVMAGNLNTAVDSFFVDIANATGKKALNMLHTQYGALHSYKFINTSTLSNNTDEGMVMNYSLVVSEMYDCDTVYAKISINNQTGKLKIYGFSGNYTPSKEELIQR